jgi:alpha-D-xyloside xylohydrolase
MFGSDLLVGPLFDDANSRDMYLPPGNWIDYQTGRTYAGGWHRIEAGKIPVILLVRDGSVIPHIKLAQSTRFMDWSELELRVFASKDRAGQAWVCLPGDTAPSRIDLNYEEGAYRIATNPFGSRVRFRIVQGNYSK